MAGAAMSGARRQADQALAVPATPLRVDGPTGFDPSRIEIIAKTICRSGKFETGEGTCSLLCMEFLGDPRSSGCAHAARIHGDMARQIVTALEIEVSA
jgi:hypothetical protein